MRPYLDSVINALLDRSSHEWIEGLLVALLLALALAGAHIACRRWLKVKGDAAPLAGLAVIAIFAGMVIASVYIQVKMRAAALATVMATNTSAAGGPGAAPGGAPGGGPGPGGGGRGQGAATSRMADLIFENADTDHD